MKSPRKPPVLRLGRNRAVRAIHGNDGFQVEFMTGPDGDKTTWILLNSHDAFMLSKFFSQYGNHMKYGEDRHGKS